MTPFELIIAECQSTGDPSVQAWAVEAVADLATLRAERDDLLAALTQAADALSDAQGEWAGVIMLYAPEDMYDLKRAEMDARAAIARATGQEVSE